MSEFKSERDAKLLILLEDQHDGTGKFHVEMEGNPEAIANAYAALTTNVIDQFAEHIGVDDTVEVIRTVLEDAFSKSSIAEALKGGE